jgi:radical SAM superfamily enzyme YgiQ (UPF0313 family)
VRMLLVYPPLAPAGSVEPPVALVTLASWLIHRGHEARILDLDLFHRRTGSALAEEGSEEFKRTLRDYQPHAVGVTSMYSNSLHAARLVALTKAHASEIVTVAGGSHFGALARESLERTAALDFVIQGEGETALAELLHQLESSRDWSKVPSLAYRRNGAIVLNPLAPLIDLADLPNVWENLGSSIDLASYPTTASPESKHRVAYVEAGRGCPYHCSFCATAPFWQRKFRVKPVQRIIDEIQLLRGYGYDRFVLLHDLLTVSRRFISDLCDALLESRMPVEWMANSRTDISLDGLLPKMKAAGCWKLFYGIESASERVQEACHKHLNLQEVYARIDDLCRHGLTSTCSFVVGFPDESRGELGASIGAGARLKLIGAETVQFHRLRLWPPADLAKEQLSTEFDEDSLVIEYPFLEVPEGDLAEISQSPAFFGGYFVPTSAAGDRTAIAQLEMFAHHAVALAPMTIAALQQFLGASTIDAIYAAIAALGPISRKNLDWEGGRLLDNWTAIKPYLVFMSGTLEGAIPRTIVQNLIAYETHRMIFATGNGVPISPRSRADSYVFETNIDVPECLRRLKAGEQIEPSILKRCSIHFYRAPDGTFQSFVGPADYQRPMPQPLVH